MLAEKPGITQTMVEQRPSSQQAVEVFACPASELSEPTLFAEANIFEASGCGWGDVCRLIIPGVEKQVMEYTSHSVDTWAYIDSAFGLQHR